MDDRLKNLADALGCLVDRGPDVVGIREREKARVRDETRRSRRELWDRVQVLHEILLEKRLDGTYDEAAARAELGKARHLLDEVAELLLGVHKNLLDPVPAPVEVPAPAPVVPSIPTLVVVPPAARPAALVVPLPPPAVAPHSDRRPGWISVERSHQELLTLQENSERLPPGELHGRCDLLLARARWLQDSPEGPHLNESQRKHLRTLFGSVQGLQKELNLPYLSTLNRDYTTDWSSYVGRLEARYGPLDERVQDLRVAEQKTEARRRAAIAQAARRRLEGAEILAQLKLFLPTLVPAEPESLAAFQRLAADAVLALGSRDQDLRRCVIAHRAYLEGPTFRGLREALQADLALTEAPPAEVSSVEAPVLEPLPSSEADHEEALQGAFPVQRGLILGGTVRPEARDMLRDHLGLISLEWWDGATIHRYGRWFQAQLIAENPSLAVILVDRLPEKDLAMIEATLDPARVVRVSGGQSLPSILAALPVPTSDAHKLKIESVDEAIRLALEEHPEALVGCFNSTSEEKGYPFQDPPAIYRALVFLATTYRDARAGRVPCPSLAERCFAACGMNYQPHQSATTMGRYASSYEATYKGQRYALTEHLGRGTNRDPRYSVRIAFRYHREDDVILLGFLGQHQRTTIS